MALLKDHAEDLPALLELGHIVGVNLHHVVVALLLGLENGQGLIGIAGRNDAIGDLRLQIGGGGGIADIGQGGPVAIGAKPVSTPGPNVGAGHRGQLLVRLHKIDLLLHLAERQTHGGAGGRDMLEGGSSGQTSGFPQLLHQLPAVECIHKVNVAGAAIQYSDREFTAVCHIELGRLLVGVAAILQFQFFHVPKPPQLCLLMMMSSVSPLERSI